MGVWRKARAIASARATAIATADPLREDKQRTDNGKGCADGTGTSAMGGVVLG